MHIKYLWQASIGLVFLPGIVTRGPKKHSLQKENAEDSLCRDKNQVLESTPEVDDLGLRSIISLFVYAHLRSMY